MLIPQAIVQETAGGSAEVSLPNIKHTQFAGTAVAGITISGYSPVAGDRIVLALDGFSTGQATNVSSTNTTWTQMITFDNAGNQRAAIWIGVCAASPGTVISVTHPNAFMSLRIVIIDDVLTPTLVQGVSFETGAAVLTGVTPGHLIVMSVSTDNTGVKNVLTAGGLIPAGVGNDIVAVQVSYALTPRVDLSTSSNPSAGFLLEVT